MSQGRTRPLHCTDYCGHSIWARTWQGRYTTLTTVGIPYEPGHSIWTRAWQGHYTALTTVGIPYEPEQDKAITLHWLLWAFHMSQGMTRPLHYTDYCGHSIWARAWQGHYTVLTTVGIPYEPEQDKAITLHWLLWAFHTSQSMTKPTKGHVCPEKTDQSGHLPSLFRVFAVHLKKVQVLSYPWRCSGWSKSSLGAQVILLDLMCSCLYHVTPHHGDQFQGLTNLLPVCPGKVKILTGQVNFQFTCPEICIQYIEKIVS